jgi:hypothetical protein
MHLPAHLEMENLLLNMSFSDVVTKESILEKMRELSYSVFDNEKTKNSQAEQIKELIHLEQRVISQAMLGFLSEVKLLSMVAILMSYSICLKESHKRPLKMYQICM